MSARGYTLHSVCPQLSFLFLFKRAPGVEGVHPNRPIPRSAVTYVTAAAILLFLLSVSADVN